MKTLHIKPLGSAKMELQWKFIVLNDYIRKEQKLKIIEQNSELPVLKRNKNKPKERES